MNMHEVEVQFHSLLTFALHGGEWSASHPGHLTPMKGAPSTNWIGAWVGARASLDMVAKRNVPASAWNQTSIIQPKA